MLKERPQMVADFANCRLAFSESAFHITAQNIDDAYRLLEDVESLAWEALKLGLDEVRVRSETMSNYFSVPVSMALDSDEHPSERLQRLFEAPHPRVPPIVLQAVQEILSSNQPQVLVWMESNKTRWANQPMAELVGLTLEETSSRDLAPLWQHPQAALDLEEIKREFTQQSNFRKIYVAEMHPGMLFQYDCDFCLVEGEKLMRHVKLNSIASPPARVLAMTQ